MAHVDDIRDYIDEEEQEVRENRPLFERVRISEGEIRFLDSEQADIWQTVLDQQAHIDELEARLDDLSDQVDHHHERHERKSSMMLDIAGDLADLKDGNGDWAVCIRGDTSATENTAGDEDECTCWETTDAECAAPELGHCLHEGESA